MTGRKYLGLEIVRAVAALIVVYNHIFTFGLVPRNILLALPAQYATEAVMIFFVLSGVVITLSVERKQRYLAQKLQLVLVYLKARLLRIYPILLVGLMASVIAQRLIEKTWPDAFQVAGNALFLQSLPGYIVTAPQFNMPLWSLSYEMAYYVLFGISLLWRGFMATWCVLALSAAFLFYPPPPSGGIAAHLVSVLTLSIPWIMGHLIARWRKQLPVIPVSLGVTLLIIGLVYARCPLTRDYFDIFRLATFSLCCCPLMLGMIQAGVPILERERYLVIRIPAAIGALLLLWTISPSLLVVKLALTIAAILAALIPLVYVEKGLSTLEFARPIFVYIGSVSYAIYAIHTPIISLTAYFLPSVGSASKIFATCAIILAISYIMEYIVQPVFSGSNLVRAAT